MSKLSLIGVGLVALLMAMTGVASATVITYPIGDQSPPFECGDVEVEFLIDGNNVTVNITYVDPAWVTGDIAIKSIGLNTPVGLSVVAVDGATLNAASVESFGEFGDFSTTVGFDTSAGLRTPGPITITFNDTVTLVPNLEGYTLAAHVIGLEDGQSLKVADGVCGEVPIPEFPTVALPIAAVIGLAFLLQRRKA